jgi:hypothetical protein
MTAWEQVEPVPRPRSPNLVLWFLVLAGGFFAVGLLVAVGVLGLRALWPLVFPPPQVESVHTALVGPDMQVVVITLREEIVLDGAALILEGSDEAIEPATPVGEKVDTIAFFVPLYGSPVMLDNLYVARRDGAAFRHKFKEQE